MTTSHNTRQHFAFSHAHSGTDGPEVTVIYTGQNLKSNAFRLGLKKIYFSIGLDNGKRKTYFFAAVWNGVQITCGSEYRQAIRRVSIFQPSLFYFSLRISKSLNGGLYQSGTNPIFFRS